MGLFPYESKKKKIIAKGCIDQDLQQFEFLQHQMQLSSVKKFMIQRKKQKIAVTNVIQQEQWGIKYELESSFKVFFDTVWLWTMPIHSFDQWRTFVERSRLIKVKDARSLCCNNRVFMFPTLWNYFPMQKEPSIEIWSYSN